MFFIWLGCIIFSICTLVGEYLLIRIAVRDGIDSSSTSDWKEMYILEQDRSREPLPTLENMYKEAGESHVVTTLPINERKAEIERIVARRARKTVKEAKEKRFILTVVGIIAGAVISALMIFGGLQAEQKKESDSHSVPSRSYSSTFNPVEHSYEEYLEELDRYSDSD